MRSFTVRLKGRKPRELKLEHEEAFALSERGFRFAIFRPQEELYRLSVPYQTIEDRDRDALTFMQDDG